MAEEKKGGVSVYISPEIVEVLKQRHKKNYEAGVDPLMTPEPSIGSLVRSYLLAALGMHKNYGGE